MLRWFTMRSVWTVVLLAAAAGCTDEVGPTPVITAVEPAAICPTNDNDPVFVFLTGSGFVINDDHTPGSVVELWRDGFVDIRKTPQLERDLEGRRLTLLFSNGEGANASNEPPIAYELRVVNPDDQFAVHESPFVIHSTFGFGPISPTTATAGSHMTMNLSGTGFYGPMRVTIESQVPTSATQVQVTSTTTATATFDLGGVGAGTYAVTMRNAGGCRVTVVSAFTVTPP
jgi:hypothetical protein